MNVFIDNLKNHRKSVSLESIFGKDSLKLYKTCEAIWLGWLHPYKGCYEANVPTILDFNFKANIPFNSSFDAEYKKFTQNGWRNILKKKKKWQSLKLNGKLTLTVSLRSLPKLQVITMPPLLGVAPIMPNVVISGWYRRTMNNLVYSLSKYNIH